MIGVSSGLQGISVNGEPREIRPGMDIADLLRTLDVDPEQVRGVAVAVNDEVLPRREWPGHALAPGDQVEIVTAKQGG